MSNPRRGRASGARLEERQQPLNHAVRCSGDQNEDDRQAAALLESFASECVHGELFRRGGPFDIVARDRHAADPIRTSGIAHVEHTRPRERSRRLEPIADPRACSGRSLVTQSYTERLQFAGRRGAAGNHSTNVDGLASFAGLRIDEFREGRRFWIDQLWISRNRHWRVGFFGRRGRVFTRNRRGLRLRNSLDCRGLWDGCGRRIDFRWVEQQANRTESDTPSKKESRDSQNQQAPNCLVDQNNLDNTRCERGPVRHAIPLFLLSHDGPFGNGLTPGATHCYHPTSLLKSAGRVATLRVTTLPDHTFLQVSVEGPRAMPDIESAPMNGAANHTLQQGVASKCNPPNEQGHSPLRRRPK